jgi:hypothetical protein
MNNSLDLPPFPTIHDRTPRNCEAVRFYLAIADELPLEQVRILSEHAKLCPECAAEFRLLQRVNRMMAAMPPSTPSARVDAAVLAALQNQQQATRTPIPLSSSRRQPSRRPPLNGRVLMLAAAILLALLGSGFFLRGLIFPSNFQAFQLPASLSWGGYVLHYTQTRTTTDGKTYQVEVYQDLGDNSMHIESTMNGVFDVVVVTDNQDMLGKDMMHHVAQEGNGVEDWAVDGSMFNLTQLRHDLATHQAVYLGTGTFQGQAVYRIRSSDGQVLLLNMRYFPVNVLDNSSNTGTSMYNTFTLMPEAQVSDSMWDMRVPSHFQMGQLPSPS